MPNEVRKDFDRRDARDHGVDDGGEVRDSLEEGEDEGRAHSEGDEEADEDPLGHLPGGVFDVVHCVDWCIVSCHRERALVSHSTMVRTVSLH